MAHHGLVKNTAGEVTDRGKRPFSFGRTSLKGLRNGRVFRR